MGSSWESQLLADDKINNTEITPLVLPVSGLQCEEALCPVAWPCFARLLQILSSCRRNYAHLSGQEATGLQLAMHAGLAEGKPTVARAGSGTVVPAASLSHA